METRASEDRGMVEPFSLTIFGGTGDLSRRKLLPTLYHLYAEGRTPGFSVLGLGSRSLTDQEYRDFCDQALRRFAGDIYDEKSCRDFLDHLFYMQIDLTKIERYGALLERIRGLPQARETGEKPNLAFYLSVPPSLVPAIIDGLRAAEVKKLLPESKIVLEKPFGENRLSATELNNRILGVFEEHQIYRIDHYLGKDTVQNIIFFRFSNGIFEPLWNRRYIDHIQITAAESLGIEHRGKFYEQAGVVKDIIQNHIMQLIALVGMEPPVGFEADLIRDEKVKLMRTIRVMDPEYIDQFTVRGQYGTGSVEGKSVPGYREEPGVAPDSSTPTFFAGKCLVDNWRWAGVPFYIRAGKRMPRRSSEIYVVFKQPPLRLLGDRGDAMEPNAIVLNIQPEEAISLGFSVKRPGIDNNPHAVHMRFSYEESFGGGQHPAYERLIIDCLNGDLTLFARQDGVETMWSIVDPVVERWASRPAPDFPNYAAGTWGPDDAAKLMEAEDRKWRE